MTKVIHVFESQFQGESYMTVLDSRGLLWGAKCSGLPYEWKRINSPPGCVGEFNEGEDTAYYIEGLPTKPEPACPSAS